MSKQTEYRNRGLHITTGLFTRSEVVPPKKPPSAPRPKPVVDSKSQQKAEKAFRKKEFVVEGNAVTLANPDYRSNQTIAIDGVGQVLSGQYYVEMVRHTWSKSGYDQQLELRSNTAGGLKVTKHPPPAQKTPARPPKPPVKPKPTPQKTYTVKSGDTLWAIARKEYGNGNQWRKIWEVNKSMLIQRDARNKTQEGHWIYPGMKLIIPD